MQQEWANTANVLLDYSCVIFAALLLAFFLLLWALKNFKHAVKGLMASLLTFSILLALVFNVPPHKSVGVVWKSTGIVAYWTFEDFAHARSALRILGLLKGPTKFVFGVTDEDINRPLDSFEMLGIPEDGGERKDR